MSVLALTLLNNVKTKMEILSIFGGLLSMYELYLTPKIAHLSNNHSCVLSQLLCYWVKDQFYWILFWIWIWICYLKFALVGAWLLLYNGHHFTLLLHDDDRWS